MASGGRSVGRRGICTICNESFEGREAVLPCSHSFCQPCVAGLANVEEHQDCGSDGGRLTTTVTCPTCQRVSPVPAGGVTAFQAAVRTEGTAVSLPAGHRGGGVTRSEVSQLKMLYNLMKADLVKLQGDMSDVVHMKSDLAKMQADISDLMQIKLDVAKMQADISDLMQIKSDVAKMQGDISDLGQMKMDVAKMQGDISDLGQMKMDVAKMQGDISDLGQMKMDVAKMQGDISDLRQMKPELAKMQADLCDLSTGKSAVASCTRQVMSIEQNVRCLQDGVQDNRKTLAALKGQLVTANTQVAFSAVLSQRVTTSKEQTLICGGIVTNVGGGYDAHTGVFTVPLAGVYCFMANTSPGDPGGTKRAGLAIVVDSGVKGYVYSEGISWSTGHTVVKLKAGQKVWLRTYSNGEYTFFEGWTFFTGMLLQADL